MTASVTDPSTHPRVPTRAFLNATEIGYGAEMTDRFRKVRSKVKSRILSTITGLIATLRTDERII